MTETSEATLSHGRAVAAALLGVDRLYRTESGDRTGLAVLNMDTEGSLEPDGLASYDDARTRWEELRAGAATLPEADRRVYYEELARSTLAFVDWRDRGLPLEAQLGSFLHVPVGPAPEPELDALRERIRRLLGRLGYGGDLRAQCAAWEARHRVPADEVEGVTAELLAEAWDRTNERVLPIPADRSDGMRVETVRGVPYNARCDYLERTIRLNVEPTLTLPGLRHLVAHEAYPGHYLQFKVRETLAKDGRAPADNLLSIVNSASSCVFEGIADTGLALIGWDESDDDRVQSLLTRYRAGIGTGAAWRLHALGQSPDRVSGWLREQSLAGGEGWVRNRMAFVAAPQRAVLIWSYWWGEPSGAPVLRRTPQVDRARVLRYLYSRMHSNRTVGMFR